MESTCLTDLPQKKNGGAGEIQVLMHRRFAAEQKGVLEE
jgi:hypothetical protein